MPYGTVKVDNIIFTDGGGDRTITVSGLYASTSGNLTVTGTISGATVQATSGIITTVQTVTGIFGLGSAASPSITFSGDLDNGLYSPGANQVAISTSGTGRLFVDSLGRVGIGTASPAARLDIAATGDGTELLRFSTERSWSWLQTSSGATTGIAFKDNTGTKNFTILSSTNDINTRFISSNVDSANNRVYFHEATAGRVGIGNNSANGTLHVTAASSVNPFIAEGPSSEFARIDSSGRLLVGASTALGVGTTTPASLLIETTTGSLPAAFTRNDASATGPILSFGKSRGTTAGSLTAVINADILGELRFAGADGTTRNSVAAQIQARVDGNPATSDMPGRLVFGTTPAGSASSVERMRIASNGNVSVGTTTSTGTKFLVSASGDGSTSYHGIRVVPVFDSTASTYAASFVSVVDVEDTTWTLPNLDHFVANQSAFGAATVTSQFGFKVNSSLTGATNNYGFFSNLASATGRWNFYANGTADSYFASNNFIFANGGTEKARVDSSGRLLVGTSTSVLATIGTEAALTQIVGATPQLMILARSADAVPAHYIIGKARGTSNEIVLNNDNLGLISFQGADGTNLVRAAEIRAQVDGTPGLNDMPGRLMFSTTADGASSPTERMRIRSDGGIGFGGIGAASVGFYNTRNITGGTTAYANYVNADALSDVTSTAYAHATSLGTTAASFTLNNLVHYNASQALIGAGSTVTNQYGFNAASTISGATNNYGFYSNLTSGTGRWNFYANGTADSYFASNNFIFAPAGTEKARFDSSGRLLVGTSSAQTIGTSSSWSLQVATAGIAAIRPSNDANPCTLTIAKTRSTSVGTYAIVQNNDYIGVIDFVADDGTDYVTPAARISAEVDGTPGINDMPGRLVFSTTADGASSPTEQWRISNGGTVIYNQPAPAAVDVTATLTVANLTAKIITSTTAAAVTMTLPTGTLMDGGFSGLYNNMAFEWTVINTGGTNAVTVQAGASHTLVGSGTVAANGSGRFLSRRTAATTWVTYRLAT